MKKGLVRFRVTLVHLTAVFALIVLLSSCGIKNNDSGGVVSIEDSYAPKPANFRVSMIDAPLKGVKSVFVNIQHFEILLHKEDGADPRRLRIAHNLGPIDLLTLRNGVMLPLADLEMPEGLTIKQIRLVLTEEGHYLVKKGGEICEMKTPSAQQTGVKIILKGPVTLEGGRSYSMVVDFDADKSVVQRGGNNGCLLKPVLKMARFASTESENLDDDGQIKDPSQEQDHSDGSEQNNDDTDDGDGFDTTDPDTLPEYLDPDGLEEYVGIAA